MDRQLYIQLISIGLWIISSLHSCQGEKYMGCFLSSAGFTKVVNRETTLDVDLCIDHCKDYAYAAVYNAQQCMCINEPWKSGVEPSFDCYDGNAKLCPGNKAQICGSSRAIALYRVCDSGKHGTNCALDCHAQCGTGCEHNDPYVCLEHCMPGKKKSSGSPVVCSGSCESNKYGPNCLLTCPNSCRSNQCSGTGTCDLGCTLATYKTDYCVESCISGRYGPNCEFTCSTMCDGGCDHESGNCNGCRDPKQWGQNCANPCSVTCKNQQCYALNGTCNQCADDTYGPQCETQCPVNCLEPTCANPNSCRQCTQDDGTCSSGCKGLFFGPKCDKECSAGKCGSNQCDQDTGLCIVCADGYYGENCDLRCPSNCLKSCNRTGSCTECLPGYYGDRCESNCTADCGDSGCDRVNGTCIDCKPGFYGEDCDEVCNYIKSIHCSAQEGCERWEGRCISCESGYCQEQCDRNCTSISPCDRSTCDVPTTTTTSASQYPATSSGYPGNDTLEEKALEITTIAIAAGCAVGAVIAIVVIILAVVFVRRRNKGRPPDTDVNGNANGGLQPDVGEALEFTVINARPEVSDPGTRPPIPTPNQERKKPVPAPRPDPPPRPDEPVPIGEEYEDVGSNIRVSNLGEFIRRRSNADFQKEYKELKSGELKPWVRAKECLAKNRFKGLMAFDHSRVVLPLYGRDSTTDYINANFLPGYKSQKAFIGAQGPTESTVSDFWRMIWDQRSNTVVALAQLIEQNKSKFYQYWPEQSSTYADVTVTLTSQTKLPDYTIREMHIQKDGEERSISQFHFTAWPDQGVPSTAAPLLNFHRKVKKHASSNTAPIIVHCSAGIGRTGTFAALDYLLDEAKETEQIDVRTCVNKLRECRINMVQTPEQYVFLYHALHESTALGQTTIPTQYLSFVMKTDSMNDQAKLKKQFEMLEQIKPQLSETDLQRAMSDENRSKNRFRNIVSAGVHHVVLQSEIEGRNDYINAAWAHGYKRENAFQVTQMPLTDTVVDLWRMIWDYKPLVFVVLVDMNEAANDVIFCPALNAPLLLPPFEISCTYKKQVHRHLGVMKVTLKKAQTEELYYNYSNKSFKDDEDDALDYENHGPDICHNLEIVWVQSLDPRTINQAYQQVSQHVNDQSPVAIMCSDGASKCGIYINSHNLIDMAIAEREVDIFDTVRQTRLTRPHFISDLKQLQLLYDIVGEYIDKFSAK